MNGTGPKISSRSGAVSWARGRTNAQASARFDVNMPRRSTRKRARLTSDSAATSVTGSGQWTMTATAR